MGGGGYDDEKNITIGKSSSVDILLFDTFSKDVEMNQDSGWHYDLFLREGVKGKPIVNVELYGGWTGQFRTEHGEAGYHSPEHKSIHHQDVDAAASRPGLSVFLHSSLWFQGPGDGLPLRYDLGGDGTADDLGVRWWFEYVKKTRVN